MPTTDQTTGFSAARRRSLILASLIVIVTLFWVLLLNFTNLPTIALGAVAVISLITLSIGTAWAAMALPGRTAQDSGSQ